MSLTKSTFTISTKFRSIHPPDSVHSLSACDGIDLTATKTHSNQIDTFQASKLSATTSSSNSCYGTALRKHNRETRRWFQRPARVIAKQQQQLQHQQQQEILTHTNIEEKKRDTIDKSTQKSFTIPKKTISCRQLVCLSYRVSNNQCSYSSSQPWK